MFDADSIRSYRFSRRTNEGGYIVNDDVLFDYKNNKVKVDLSKLYPDIDIAETLSNLRGKYIKKISKNEVEFEDGEKVDIKNLDYRMIKDLIWW